MCATPPLRAEGVEHQSDGWVNECLDQAPRLEWQQQHRQNK